MDHDRLNLGNSLQDSNNEIEFVEIKMEPPEELDVCQMASEPNAASCNQVDSSIGDPPLLKEDKEQPQDNPDLLPTDFLTLEHSVADHNDEPSVNSVPSGVEQSVNKLEPEQPPSSPFHSCTKYEPGQLSAESLIPKHSVFDSDDEHSGRRVCKGQSPNRFEVEQPASTPFFSCTQCDYKCARITVLNKHIRSVHAAPKSSESGSNQNRDTKRSSSKSCIEGKLFSCELCDYKTIHSDSLEKHICMNPTREEHYSCEFCEFKTIQSSDLKIHLKKHTGEKRFSCEVCEFKTTTLGLLKLHLRKHTGVKPFQCELCEYKTFRSDVLKAHHRTHTGETPYNCEFCEFKASQSGQLIAHMRKHTGEKPFSCKLCEYKTAYSSHLKRHLRNHTGEKPFSCDFCEFKTAQSSHLKLHLRNHTGDKPFSCEFCEFKTAQSSHLKSHQRKHTRETPYTCDLCKFKTTRLCDLKRHQKKHSG